MSSFRPVVRQEEARVLIIALEAGLQKLTLEPDQVKLILRFIRKISEFDQTALVVERLTGQPYDVNELIEASRVGINQELTPDEFYEIAIAENTKEEFAPFSDAMLESGIVQHKDPIVRERLKAELVRRERDNEQQEPSDSD